MQTLKIANVLERKGCCLIAAKSQTRGVDWGHIWTRGGDAEGGGGLAVCGQIRIALLLLVLLGGDLIFCPFPLLDDVVRVGVRLEDDGEEDVLQRWGGYGEGFHVEKILLVLQDSKEGGVTGEALVLSHGKAVRSLPVISFISAESQKFYFS